jgi:Domain of unknown function (DUF1844)
MCVVAESEGSDPPGEPSVDELIEAIRGIRVGQFLLSTASTLASLAYGKLDSGDLDETRAAIEALRALLPALEGQVDPEAKRDLERAVTNLQIAYADAAGSAG